ncbi:NAD(P)H-hydrate dehydratase [Lachnospiraceae bacterium 45-P1]
MRYLVTGKEMKEIDKRSIEEFGIPSMVLMERAALEVAKKAEEILKKKEAGTGKKGTVWAVCGLGNNGADGVAAVRMLFLHGFCVSVILPGAEGRKSEEMEAQLAIAGKLKIPVFTAEDFIPGSCDLIIDAVFGIGLSRNVEGPYEALIDLMRTQKDAAVVSVDIPSGINSDTGAVMGCAVQADVTVTFGEKKLGQALFPGREACGELLVADIGFVPEEKEKAGTHALCHTREDLKKIPKRKPDSHKGTYGKILVIAGSPGMAGAAYFSALAAYRTGAGLVKAVTPEENRSVLQGLLPEAVLSTYETEQAVREPEEFREYLKKQTDWADVIVLGPGIGVSECGRIMVEAVLKNAYVPVILDADAINLAARYPHLKGYFTENIMLTPHLSEFSRLSGQSVEETKENLVSAAKGLSDQYGATCVLKDAATVTARKDGKVFVNTSGSPAMAKGGSGDVLTGIIAGLLALGMDECEAASLGVYVHGLAGERAAEKFGVHSVLASQIADCVGEVINETV